eukprot:Awhi_evm2s1733
MTTLCYNLPRDLSELKTKQVQAESARVKRMQQLQEERIEKLETLHKEQMSEMEKKHSAEVQQLMSKHNEEQIKAKVLMVDCLFLITV